jgi:hypothetical protein
MRKYFILFLLALSGAVAQPTYHKDISRILRAKCEICHRENDIAPFTMKDYAQVVDWAADIKLAVTDGRMPPWKPVAGHGNFRDNYGLTDDEKKTLLDWIDGGTPEGDPADGIETMGPQSEWPLGYPSQIITMPQAFTPARGQDVYRCFVLDPRLTENKWLKGVDFLPGNRSIVHHILIYQDTDGTGDRLDAADPGPGYDCFGGPGIEFNNVNLSNISSLLRLGKVSLGGWAPGQRSHLLPDGIGMELEKGAKIIMQVHYFPVGRTGEDQTTIGLYFADEPQKQQLYMLPVVNTNFRIPANNEAYDVRANLPVFLPATAVWVYPHMHLLGQKIRVEATDLAGRVTPLMFIDKWDFNWQGSYTYVDPVRLPLGGQLRLTCTFDNSAKNARNPNNPIQPVGWGERTTDEMCLAFMGVVIGN